MKTAIVAALAFNTLVLGPSFAAQKCDVPVDQWQPREKLQAALEAKGWQIRSIATEDGCYEAYAIDDKGAKVEAYFNPKTLEQVKSGDEDSEG